MIFNITSLNFQTIELLKIFELCSDIIAVIDEKYRVKFANQNFLKAFECSSDEMAGKDFFSIHQIFILWKNYKDSISENLLMQGKWEGELEVKSASLVSQWYKVALSVLKDDKERISGYALVAKDITHWKSTVINNISDRKKSEILLKESEERYRLLFELSPDAIIVYENGIILNANSQAAAKLGVKSPLEIIGVNILDFVHPDYIETVKQRMYKRQVHGETVPPMLHKIVRPDGKVLDAEVLGAPLPYEGKHIVQIVLRDVTDNNKIIQKAIEMQEHRQELSFPLKDKVHLETLYKPAELLSGDFYEFHKVNEDVVIGLVGDVTGKGITSALNISAMKVIFHGGASDTKSPLELIKYMNKEVQRHLVEDYVSCCCFEMNFKTGYLRVVGAGINEFIKISKDAICKKIAAEGPPLGMFDDINYDQVTVTFSKGDIFNFFSDGIDFIYNYDELSTGRCHLVHDQLKTYLEEQINILPKLQDDCTWLSIKII